MVGSRSITGSGRGIGREFALSMAREGANIVINDVGVSLDGQGTDEDPAAQTVQGHQGARRAVRSRATSRSPTTTPPAG